MTLTAEWGGDWTRARGDVNQTLPLSNTTVGGAPLDYRVVEIQTVGTDV